MAITVTRDKNIISVLVEGKNSPYTFDINTGVVNGLRGKPIKTVTKEVFRGICPFDYNHSRNTNLTEVIYYATSWGSYSHIGELSYYADELKLADSLDNLDIKIINNVSAVIKEFIRNKKLCKAYIKYAQECKKKNVEYNFNSFKQMQDDIVLRSKFSFDITAPEFEGIRNQLVNLTEWATDREIKSFVVNFIDTKWYTINDTSARSLMWSQFKKYCECCREIEEKVSVKPNFITEYPRVYKAYMAQKEEIDRRKFKRAMDIHRAEMEFEYGNFKVVVPTTPQEIKDEGKNMHHCVASYAYSVMETNYTDRSHIVFVRYKNTPDKCYITCEIRNGTICQYYLSHDRYISTDEDREFKKKYQEHLNKTWKRE